MYALLVLASLLLSGGAAAQAPAARPQDVPSPSGGSAAAARGFLWQAVRGSSRVLLMGTVHLGRDGQTTLPAEHVRHLRDSAALVLEADVFDAQRIQAALQRYALLSPRAQGLDRTLPPPLRSRAQRLIERYGLAPDVAWRFKAWALANNLVVLESMQSGLNPAYSTEAQLYAAARAAGLPVLELEGVEAQLALFDSMPDGLPVAYLDEAVGSIERGQSRRELDQLVEAWRTGDESVMASTVERMRVATLPVDRWVLEQLIESRHPEMVNRIERMAASGRLHLVAVGTLHFFGPNSLLAGLRARGFEISRLP
jgi:uncharacterized protein YbaP (TraB family)